MGKWTGDSYRNCIGKLNHFNCEGDCLEFYFRDSSCSVNLYAESSGVPGFESVLARPEAIR